MICFENVTVVNWEKAHGKHAVGKCGIYFSGIQSLRNPFWLNNTHSCVPVALIWGSPVWNSAFHMIDNLISQTNNVFSSLTSQRCSHLCYLLLSHSRSRNRSGETWLRGTSLQSEALHHEPADSGASSSSSPSFITLLSCQHLMKWCHGSWTPLLPLCWCSRWDQAMKVVGCKMKRWIHGE